MRWVWIDRFVEFESGSRAKAIKNITLAEEHLHDHFPGFPVMPAALMLEGLAQTGGILVGEANDYREKVVLAKIPRAIFHREHVFAMKMGFDRFDSIQVDDDRTMDANENFGVEL